MSHKLIIAEPFSEKMNYASLDYFVYTKTRAFYKASLSIP